MQKTWQKATLLFGSLSITSSLFLLLALTARSANNDNPNNLIVNAKNSLKTNTKNGINSSLETQTYSLYSNTYNKEEYFKSDDYYTDLIINEENWIPTYLTDSHSKLLQSMKVSLIGFLDDRAVVNFYYEETKTNWAIVLDSSSTDRILKSSYYDKTYQLQKEAIVNFDVVENNFDTTSFSKIDQGFIVTPKSSKQKSYINKNSVDFRSSLWSGRKGDSGYGDFEVDGLDMDVIADSLATIYENEIGSKNINVVDVVPYLRSVTIAPDIYIYNDPMSKFNSDFNFRYDDKVSKNYGSKKSTKTYHDVPSSRSENWFYAVNQLFSIAGLAIATAGLVIATGGATAPLILAGVGVALSAASLGGTILNPIEISELHGSSSNVKIYDYLDGWEDSLFDLNFSGRINYYGSAYSKAVFGDTSGAKIKDIDIYLEFGLKGKYVS